MERTITFGKYKGRKIADLLFSHIGYIMWCLDNISWFSLTDEEQRLYDYISIAAMKSRCRFTFPVEGLAKHIRDREALERKYTPFEISENGIVSCSADFESPLVSKRVPRGSSGLYDLLSDMALTLNKFDRYEAMDEYDEYLCEGDFI